MTAANDSTAELKLEVRGETDRAWRVFDGDIECWLPKSQVDPEQGTKVGGTHEFLVPQWLAEERGLV